jgi:hypothetical protein
MSERELSDEETRTLIDYARRKFAEERWPLSPALRPVREIMEKLDPKPVPVPAPLPGTGKARSPRAGGCRLEPAATAHRSRPLSG